MAVETKCQTPDAEYMITIGNRYIYTRTKLPFRLTISEDETKILDSLLHNAIEVVLRPYFMGKGIEGEK
jgi:hypothetical protein